MTMIADSGGGGGAAEPSEAEVGVRNPQDSKRVLYLAIAAIALATVAIVYWPRLPKQLSHYEQSFGHLGVVCDELKITGDDLHLYNPRIDDRRESLAAGKAYWIVFDRNFGLRPWCSMSLAEFREFGTRRRSFPAFRTTGRERIEAIQLAADGRPVRRIVFRGNWVIFEKGDADR